MILAALALVALLAIACGDGSDSGGATPAQPSPAAASTAPAAATDTSTPAQSSPTATPPTTATIPASPTPAPPLQTIQTPLDHEIENAMAHVRKLAVDIGPRVSGTSAAEATVAYISDTLRSYGYAVEVTEFTYPTRFRPATITIDGERVHAMALSGPATPPQTVEGPAYGDGAPEGATADGAVMVAERDPGRSFMDEDRTLLAMADRAGAAALIIVNREPSPFYGFLNPVIDPTPVVLAPQTEGERLAQAVAAGATITIEIGPDWPLAANVIARPADGARCDLLAGGHHDTVSASPGALDNASGVAIVLELARLFAADGLDEGLCFATFGAEESGLFGSAFLVEEWAPLRELPRVMVNFDVTARGDAIGLIGTQELVDRSLALLTDAGVPAARSSLPANAGSDHMSFVERGVPVLFFSDSNFDRIHTPRDVFELVEPEAVDRFGDGAALVITALLAEIAGGR